MSENISNTDQTKQSCKTCVSDSFYHDDEDSLLDYYFESEAELTEEDQIKKLDELNKCADFILKNKITPNMDGIY